MERAHSAPPEGSENAINPFYSSKLQNEMKLVRARPHTLPQVVSPVEPSEPLPIRSEGAIGKGRGSSATGTAVKGGAGAFVTPPSRRTPHGFAMNLELGKQHERSGVQTEGPMPTTKLGRSDDHQQGHVHGVGEHVDLQEQRSTEDLQRSLERGIGDHLRDQNAKMMLELEELRKWK